MLILGRALGESVVMRTIDVEIRITVHQLGPCFVKLAIEAPQSVPVDREEVAIAKQTGRPVRRCRGHRRMVGAGSPGGAFPQGLGSTPSSTAGQNT